ncbi:hypothetical protein FQA39_LY12579 [Lamprigera yunnana]|nr:hypothetical protein FQA39_LY12579 [Lamprigera yunnana]
MLYVSGNGIPPMNFCGIIMTVPKKVTLQDAHVAIFVLPDSDVEDEAESAQENVNETDIENELNNRRENDKDEDNIQLLLFL